MRSVAIVGSGPAGLFAAECLAGAGFAVELFDAMPAPGRKFLVAGRGGLNLTHAEPLAAFIARYGLHHERFARYLAAFTPTDLQRNALVTMVLSIQDSTTTETVNLQHEVHVDNSP